MARLRHFAMCACHCDIVVGLIVNETTYQEQEHST